MEAMKGNTNAETWTLEQATELFNNAIELTEGNSKYDFIGEVAKKLGTYRDVFTYLKKKYKELKPLSKRLISNIEANCFSHGKNGDINTAMAIVNLKSNHGWTDRVDNTTKDKKVSTTTVINLGHGNNPKKD
jgi:hypothetical protein